MLIVIAVAVAAGVWAAVLFHAPLLGLGTFILLVGAVGEFLLPVRYRLTPAGAEARNPFYWRKIAWTEVKRVYAGEEVVKLSPLAYGGPREAYRGVVLRPEGNRDEVLAAIERFRDAADRDRADPGRP